MTGLIFPQGHGAGAALSWEESEIRTGTSGAIAAMYTRHLVTVADSMEPEDLRKQQVSDHLHKERINDKDFFRFEGLFTRNEI